MLRTDFDISDEDFEKVNQPFAGAIDNYIKETFLDEYIAFYIATGYNMDALFVGKLSGTLNAAVDSLCDIKYGTKEDLDRLKNILKDKYHLLLKDDVELDIEEMKEDR